MPVVPLRRRKKSTVAVIVTLAIVGAVLAYSAIGAIEFARVRDAVRSISTLPPADENGIHNRDLTSYLMPVPSDATPWKNAPTDEDIDLSNAAEVNALTELGGSRLSPYGFSQGHVRRWVNDQQTEVAVMLLQFTSVTEADRYYAYLDDLNRQAGWGTSIPIPGVSHGEAYQWAMTDVDGNTLSLAMAAAGDTVVLVGTDETTQDSDYVCSTTLATQYARL